MKPVESDNGKTKHEQSSGNGVSDCTSSGRTHDRRTALTNLSQNSRYSSASSHYNVKVIDLLKNPQIGRRRSDSRVSPPLVRKLPRRLRRRSSVICPIPQRVLIRLDLRAIEEAAERSVIESPAGNTGHVP